MRARLIAAVTIGLTVVAGPAIAFATSGSEPTPTQQPAQPTQQPAQPVQQPAQPVQQPAQPVEGDLADPANPTQLPAQPVPGL